VLTLDHLEKSVLKCVNIRTLNTSVLIGVNIRAVRHQCAERC